jgi:hypothetical protein
MSGTQMIHDLVQDGRATPAQGAMLIEFRRELEVGRARQLRRNKPVMAVLVAIGTFLLVLLGIQNNTSVR